MKPDWSRLAQALLERLGEPACIFARDDTIVRANAELAALFGVAPAELSGAAWPARDPEELGALLDRMRLGIDRSVVLPAQIGPRQLNLHSRCELIGGNEALLVMFETWDALPASARTGVQAYQIAIGDHDWGRVLAANGRPFAVGKRCWELVCSGQEPCAGCPARDFGEQDDHRSGFVSCANRVWYVTADRVSDTTAWVTVHRMAGSDFESLLHARLTAIGEQYGLSRRERDVLKLLTRACADNVIAERLSITPRTVKFHRLNVMRKLGLDSAAGLAAIVLNVSV